jgi:putative endonuclease
MTLKGCTGSTPVPGTMFFVYILQSEKNERFYVGYSEFPDRRIIEHNSGKVKSTKPHRPWSKVYEEVCLTELEAIRREREIKSRKSRVYILKLIGRHVPTEGRDDP